MFSHALFTLLNTAGEGRLVVLDQFENVLDDEGYALPDRPGIGEWLDALNSQPCACRILLTSRPDPQGTRPYPQTCLHIYHVEGLSEAEGIELLHKWSVQAGEAESRTAIQRCKGHALSLTLLASLLQTRNVSLAMLLKDPQYTQLWTGDIAQALLDATYKALDSLERRLLAGSGRVSYSTMLAPFICPSCRKRMPSGVLGRRGESSKKLGIASMKA